VSLVQSEFPEILEEPTPSVTPTTNSQKVRVCANCGETYVLTPDKPGLIGQCAACGAESEVERVKGIPLPTGAKGCGMQLQVVTAKTHKEFKRLSRVGSVRTH
jgi:hypothetical protein